jgi:hypothetical protein
MGGIVNSITSKTDSTGKSYYEIPRNTSIGISQFKFYGKSLAFVQRFAQTLEAIPVNSAESLALFAQSLNNVPVVYRQSYGDSALNPPSSVAHACLRGDRGRLWLRCAP